MMKRRKQSSEQKLKTVLEDLSGQTEIGKLCNKYQISQVLYYRWRDQLLQYGQQVFETKNITKKEKCLEDENRSLKQIIGDLTIELKKASIYDETKEILIGYKKKYCYPYLYYRQDLIVNKKRIYRLMKEYGLSVTKINKY